MTMRLCKDYLPYDASLEKEPTIFYYEDYLLAREWRLSKITGQRDRLRAYFDSVGILNRTT